MKYEERIQTGMEYFEDKYGMPTNLALVIDIIGLAVGAWLLAQSSILLTIVGIPFVLSSAGGLLNKTVHRGSD